MSILDVRKLDTPYAIIHDWILSPPSKFIKDLYVIHHARLSRHAPDIAKRLLNIFSRLTLISEFNIIHNTKVRVKDSIYEVMYKESKMYENQLDGIHERTQSETFYDELIQHDMKYDVYEIEAILEDMCICKNPKGWIGNAFKELWPFLSFAHMPELSPGMSSCVQGVRVIYKIYMIPIMCRSIQDDLYS